MTSPCVLVSGGSRGIGAGVARLLAGTGYHVIVLDKLQPEDDLDVEYHAVDLTDAEATRTTLARVARQREITRLVNNVGIVRPAPAEDTTLDDFADVINLNTRTALLCVQAVLPAMRRSSAGRIVSVTSRVVLGKELRTSYSASKGALAAMTRTWALEFARDGITVNAVAPGPIGTEAFFMNNPPGAEQTRKIVAGVPVGRLGTPEDVAHAVAFFLDERSSFVTGQTLFVCGGLTVGLSTGV
jgi:3-oxoacyl-[acyl-carrier protein] reductase